MLLDDDSKITDQLSGRTIDYVIRNNKDLEIVTTDGHTVVIASDIDHDIQFKRTDVRVVIPRVSMDGVARKI